MFRRFYWVTVLACLCSSAALPVAGGEEDAQDAASSFAARIVTVTDVVLQNHINPPVRQQMILAGVKALYLADNRRAPKELSGRVSELAGRDEIMEFLDGVRQEFVQLKNAETVLTRGMLAALPGKSFLIDAKVSMVQDQVINNRYVGTGIALRMNEQEKLAQISKVFYDGPAWKAGIKSGDLIVEIDGESTTSKKLNQVVESLRGEAGSVVEVVVRQPDSQDSRPLSVTRGRVFIPSIEGFREESDGRWKYTVDSAEDIALLRMRSIGPSTLHELRQVATPLRRQGVRGIVIDLRDGGGILHDIVMVADSLLDGGIIGHVRSWETSIQHTARPGDLFQGLPLAVLVGKHTSPGNVFLTAALQDNERAVVVGQQTAGETFVSSFVHIPGRSDRLRLATAVMLRGDGTPLIPGRFPELPLANVRAPETEKQKRRPGFIVPDHVVHREYDRGPTTDEQHAADPMLATAIEVLRHTTDQVSSARSNNISGS